jgi:hypothetical protein
LSTTNDTTRSFSVSVGQGPLKARLTTTPSGARFALSVQEGGTVLGQTSDVTPFELNVTAAAGRCTIRIENLSGFAPIQGEVDVTFQRP